MARPKNPVPSYRHHQKKNRGIVDLYIAPGKRVAKLLPGTYNSDESKAAYAKVVAVMAANGGYYPSLNHQVKPPDITVNDLVLAFMDKKASVDYVDVDGKPTSELECFKFALRPLCRIFGEKSAAAFDSADLIVVRNAMISGSWTNADEKKRLAKRGQPLGWCRTNVNKMVSRIRQIFRWGIPYKLVSAAVLTDLECLAGLQNGQGGARESNAVDAVAEEVVEKTIPHLPPIVADITQLLLMTGARCGEMCELRMADLDRTGTTWVYKPRHHKTQKKKDSTD